MLTYSQVTFKDLKDNFGVSIESKPFLPAIAPLPLPEWLRQYFSVNPLAPAVTKSEKAISELIIAPVLSAVKAHYNGQLGVFSGEPLNAAGLVGVCDFIITTNPRSYLPEPPLMVLVEAKRQDISSGIPQCVAEMIAARQLNEEAGLHYPASYGCVTTGIEWQFVRLVGEQAISDPNLLFYTDLEQVLGCFSWLIDQFNTN
ncbi:hypothetical protein GCM10027422_33360 [Hymenobacter arcticus]